MISATHIHANSDVNVFWDELLVRDPSTSGAGWTLVHDAETLVNPTMKIKAMGKITLTNWTPFAPTTGPDRISYTNPAGIVRNLSQMPALPFVDFPVS